MTPVVGPDDYEAKRGLSYPGEPVEIDLAVLQAEMTKEFQRLNDELRMANMAWGAANRDLAELTRVDNLNPENNGVIPKLKAELELAQRRVALHTPGATDE